MSKKSSRKAGRIVRYQLKDGSWQEKHYPPYQPKAGHRSGDTVADLIAAWERSPKWKKLAWRTQCQYVTYMRDLSTMSAVVATKISRRDLLDLHPLIVPRVRIFAIARIADDTRLLSVAALPAIMIAEDARS